MEQARILACDPGFERLGVAVLEKQKGEEVVLYSACIRTASSLSFPERLRELGAAVEELIASWKPTHVALEEIFFEKNAKTAISVAQVRGILAYIAATHTLGVESYTPLQVKVAITGYGKSTKNEVATMVSRLVSLPKKARLDDEMDAIAIGLTALASMRYPHAKKE